MNTSPFLSLIGLSVCLYVPASVHVVSYSCFMFPYAAASSASIARLSVKFSLSVVMLVETNHPQNGPEKRQRRKEPL